MLFKYLPVFFWAFSLTAALADECDGVIALSRNKSSTLSSSEEIRAQASNFCSSYHQYKMSGGSKSLGASYKFLAATMSSEARSVDDVASNYCSAESDYSRYNDKYSSYIDQIAPGAMAAYSACLERKKKGVHFVVQESSILPGNFVLFVVFDAAGAAAADITVAPLEGVECRWNTESGDTHHFISPSQASLRCKRSDISTKTAVALSMNNGIDNFVMPWPAYTKEGVPIDHIKALQESLNQKIENVKTRLIPTKSRKECLWTSDYQQDCVATCSVVMLLAVRAKLEIPMAFERRCRTHPFQAQSGIVITSTFPVLASKEFRSLKA